MFGYLQCFTAGQDNTACCKGAELENEACLPLCDGTKPLVTGMASQHFDVCTSYNTAAYGWYTQKDFRKIVICNMYKHAPPSTTASPVPMFPALECPRITTIDVNGTKVASCASLPGSA